MGKTLEIAKILSEEFTVGSGNVFNPDFEYATKEQIAAFLKPLLTQSEVFVVWCNTDLTEGRGYDYPVYTCRKEATAWRLAKGINVQGSNGRVEKVNLYRIDGTVYGPTLVTESTKEDDKEQEKMEALNRIREKALRAGLTEEEIVILSKQ